MIAQLQRQCRQVGGLFKWVNWHLRINALPGHGGNAVKAQIRIAVCTCLPIAVVKKSRGLPHSFYEIPKILSLPCSRQSRLIKYFHLLSSISGRQKR